MSSIPIKPGAARAPITPESADSISSRRDGSFSDALDRTKSVGSGVASPAGQALPTSTATHTDAASITSLAEDIKAGRISPADAVNQLVEAALAELPLHTPLDTRKALSAHLRDALASDPALLMLQSDLAGRVR